MVNLIVDGGIQWSIKYSFSCLFGTPYCILDQFSAFPSVSAKEKVGWDNFNNSIWWLINRLLLRISLPFLHWVCVSSNSWNPICPIHQYPQSQRKRRNHSYNRVYLWFIFLVFLQSYFWMSSCREKHLFRNHNWITSPQRNPNYPGE